VRQAQRGDRTALEELVRRYLRPAYAVALGMLRNPADAEDVAQESLMVSIERLDQCREPARFAAWLLRSVRHRALNHIEKHTNRATLLERAESPVDSGVDPGMVVLRKRLLEALEVLSPSQREVVLLHDMQDWTHAEIADALEISETMSRQHLFVARGAMRRLLGKDYGKEALHE
jgi:RNA polymerase sigma-70 factor, ECF subfamily